MENLPIFDLPVDSRIFKFMRFLPINVFNKNPHDLKLLFPPVNGEYWDGHKICKIPQGRINSKGVSCGYFVNILDGKIYFNEHHSVCDKGVFNQDSVMQLREKFSAAFQSLFHEIGYCKDGKSEFPETLYCAYFEIDSSITKIKAMPFTLHDRMCDKLLLSGFDGRHKDWEGKTTRNDCMATHWGLYCDGYSWSEGKFVVNHYLDSIDENCDENIKKIKRNYIPYDNGFAEPTKPCMEEAERHEIYKRTSNLASDYLMSGKADAIMYRSPDDNSMNKLVDWIWYFGFNIKFAWNHLKPHTIVKFKRVYDKPSLKLKSIHTTIEDIDLYYVEEKYVTTDEINWDDMSIDWDNARYPKPNY